MFVPHLFRMQL